MLMALFAGFTLWLVTLDRGRERVEWAGVTHHVIDEFLKRIIEEGDRLGAAAKDIVAIFDDGEYGQNQDPRFFKLSIIASTVCLARF